MKSNHFLEDLALAQLDETILVDLPEGAVGVDSFGEPLFMRCFPISREGSLRAYWEQQRRDLGKTGKTSGPQIAATSHDDLALMRGNFEAWKERNGSRIFERSLREHRRKHPVSRARYFELLRVAHEKRRES
jgi:hypothetical protein